MNTHEHRGVRLEVHGLRHVVTEPSRQGLLGRRKTACERCLLDIPELTLRPGELLALAGPSGGGKTTLLHVLAGLLPPVPGCGQPFSEPRILWNGQDIYALSESRRDALRAALSGMIFQDFQLLDGLSALDNVLLPHRFRSFCVTAESRSAAGSLLESLGINHPDTRMERLSRGEMQRVALARALCRPAVAGGEGVGLLFADEPTASLDRDNARQVAETLRSICRERNATLICATHDTDLMDCLDRRVRLENGRLISFSGVMS